MDHWGRRERHHFYTYHFFFICYSGPGPGRDRQTDQQLQSDCSKRRVQTPERRLSSRQ
ncbi:hypothetical protein GCK32_011155 [Trichostrongylus colubriformis]|uniref:Uncharacterized protein n=1 Tax=Trichostrongylus colubriformis TaxID=6319 RepID=A0AAN8J2T0_TRICO